VPPDVSVMTVATCGVLADCMSASVRGSDWPVCVQCPTASVPALSSVPSYAPWMEFTSKRSIWPSVVNVTDWNIESALIERIQRRRPRPVRRHSYFEDEAKTGLACFQCAAPFIRAIPADGGVAVRRSGFGHRTGDVALDIARIRTAAARLTSAPSTWMRFSPRRYGFNWSAIVARSAAVLTSAGSEPRDSFGGEPGTAVPRLEPRTQFLQKGVLPAVFDKAVHIARVAGICRSVTALIASVWWRRIFRAYSCRAAEHAFDTPFPKSVSIARGENPIDPA